MSRYVALLRGINVGGHRVKMDRLRELLGELGFSDVATFIASGNVIFSTATGDPGALEREVEDHLHQHLGYEVPTFIRSPAELAAIAEREPVASWGESDGNDSLYVIFLKAPADAGLRARFSDLCSDTDDFQFSGREVYWLIRGKLSESPLFGPGVARATGKTPNTARNMTSVRKLVAKHASDG
jgi:uncharacterized protein (DUF1697 family)